MTTLEGAKTPGFRTGRRPLHMSMLSDVDETHTRDAVMILAADDPFWKVSSADELYSVLQRAFPQVCISFAFSPVVHVWALCWIVAEYRKVSVRRR